MAHIGSISSCKKMLAASLMMIASLSSMAQTQTTEMSHTFTAFKANPVVFVQSDQPTTQESCVGSLTAMESKSSSAQSYLNLLRSFADYEVVAQNNQCILQPKELTSEQCQKGMDQLPEVNSMKSKYPQIEVSAKAVNQECVVTMSANFDSSEQGLGSIQSKIKQRNNENTPSSPKMTASKPSM